MRRSIFAAARRVLNDDAVKVDCLSAITRIGSRSHSVADDHSTDHIWSAPPPEEGATHHP